jgi:hypothetical protein
LQKKIPRRKRGIFQNTEGVFLIAKALTETLTKTANSVTKATDWSFVSFGGLWLAGSLTLGGWGLGLGSRSLTLCSGSLGLGSGSLCLLGGYRGLSLAAGDAGVSATDYESESGKRKNELLHFEILSIVGAGNRHPMKTLYK